MSARFTHKGYGRYVRVFYTLSDLAIFNLVFYLALWICHINSCGDTRMMWALVNISFIGVIVRNRKVGHRDRAILLDRVAADSLLSIGIHALFFLALTELLSDMPVPRKLYLVYYSIMVIVMPAWDILTRILVKNYRRRGYNYTRVVIVGTNQTSERMREELESDAGFGYRILGFFDNGCGADFKEKEMYLGDISSLGDFVRKNTVDQIYYTLGEGEEESFKEVVGVADDTGAQFFFVPKVKASLGRGFELHSIGAMPVLAGRRNPLKSTFNSGVKRAFDIVFSSVFLICVYPFVYIPVALTIKATSPGPVYFRQKRTGYKGRSFNCLKFRTMHVNNNSDSCQATIDDPRKTRFGDFLRKTSIDELPQFINVLRGDMSVVGPRPHMLKHTEEYSKLVNRYMVRHVVRPGITGWAQVNGYRGPTDRLWKMERRVEYDVWYIENWTFLLDLKIIARTVLNMFFRDKNAF